VQVAVHDRDDQTVNVLVRSDQERDRVPAAELIHGQLAHGREVVLGEHHRNASEPGVGIGREEGVPQALDGDRRLVIRRHGRRAHLVVGGVIFLLGAGAARQ
jgi:hypothetical protein